MVFLDGKIIGSSNHLINYLANAHNFTESSESIPQFKKVAVAEYEKYKSSSNRTFVYFDFTVDGINIGRTTFQVIFFAPNMKLYADICPVTCENFLALCQTSSPHNYKGSIIHRVVQGGWIQGGGMLIYY